MNMEKINKLKYLTILTLLVVSSSCDQPKVIQAEVIQNQTSPFEFSSVPNSHKVTVGDENPSPSGAFHKVVVDEILPTEKYVYLKVKEGAQSYWIATKKMEVKKGATYYYRNGLLKTNFESKEYNRTFDKLYLVSSIVPETHGNNSGEKKDIEMHAFEGEKAISSSNPENKDILSIAELVTNKESLEGKQVTLKGKCTKVNSKIMGRNWIHLKDGSMDEYDLVVTSHEEIPVGHEVTMTGVVALKKDFGSGYYYELLVENGNLTK